jgi:hypothetical protein
MSTPKGRRAAVATLEEGMRIPPMALKLGMANKSLAAVIGVSEATVSRM